MKIGSVLLVGAGGLWLGGCSSVATNNVMAVLQPYSYDFQSRQKYPLTAPSEKSTDEVVGCIRDRWGEEAEISGNSQEYFLRLTSEKGKPEYRIIEKVGGGSVIEYEVSSVVSRRGGESAIDRDDSYVIAECIL